MPRPLITALLLALPLALLLSACADDGPSAVGGPAGDGAAGGAGASGAWVLVEGDGPDGPLPVADSHRITLTVEDQQVSGTAACNGYGGAVTAAPPAFAVDQLGVTEMACMPAAVMALEQAYLQALTGVTEIAEVDATRLVLTGPDVRLVFDALEPVPTEALQDTVWVLDGLISGTGASASVSSVRGDEAALVLHADGRMSGGTGCRALTGRWTSSGDEIQMPELSADGECPDDLRSQDGQVVSVLGDGFVPAVDGQTLTLTDGGLGLAYRAGSPEE